MNLKGILKKLCSINSICGNEFDLINLIKNEISNSYYKNIDNLNNLIVLNDNYNNSQNENKLLILSAVDEPGLIINKIEDDGSLRFDKIGNLPINSLIGSVIQLKQTKGVIGQKPIHLQTDEEKNLNTKIEDLFIDIGTNSKNETAKKVQLGELVTFENNFIEFGDNQICSKSINSKLGSSILIKMLNSQYNLNFNCAFLTKTIVCNASAAVVSKKIKPKIAIILDYEEEEIKINELNCDNTPDFILNCNPTTDRAFFNLTVNTAKKNNFNFQTKVKTKIKIEDQAIAQSNFGIKTITISIPCKQPNSNCSNVDLKKLNKTFEYLKTLIIEINKTKI